MVDVKPRDIRCHIHVTATFTSWPPQTGDSVGDDDGPSRTPHISPPAFNGLKMGTPLLLYHALSTPVILTASDFVYLVTRKTTPSLGWLLYP